MKGNLNYKTLFKATSLFGFVEILRLLLKMFTYWFASNFLGSKGFGLLGLVENVIQLINSFFSFGINFTGVRDIAANKDNELNLAKTIKAVTQFSLVTGVFAATISIVFAYQLSYLTFKTTDYFYWFIALAIYFVATSYTQSRVIYLEGSQNFHKLVRINIIVNVVNTVIIIGAYYFYDVQGIVLGMILNSLAGLLIYIKLSSVPKVTVKLTVDERKKYFKKFIKSGSLLALNTVIGFLCFFIIRWYFNITSDETLSYYNASNLIIVSYLGIIFVAMGKFFFPKLSQFIGSKDETIELINNQLELSLLIVLPAIVVIYGFSDFFISILFSEEFQPVQQILIFGLASIVCRSFNYAVGYLLLSHQNFKQYFYINAISDVLNVGLTIFFYKMCGLMGIGFSIFINYLLSGIYIYYYTNKTYAFKLNKNVLKQLVATFLIILSIILMNFIFEEIYFKVISGVIFLISSLYTLIKIDEYVLDFKIRKKLNTLF